MRNRFSITARSRGLLTHRSTKLLLLALGLLTRVVHAEPARIPLCPGLTVVTAVSQPEGDYESIKTIESIDDQQVRIKYSVERPNTDWLSSSDEEILRSTIYRTVRLEDLESATMYQQIYLENSDELIPGTTAIGTSAAVMRALAKEGELEFGYSNVPGSDYAGLTADPEIRPNYYDFLPKTKMTRAGSTTLPVLVNDRRVDLEAVHAKTQGIDEESEFFFLADERNPLTLKFRTGIGGIRPMDPALAEACKGLAENGIGMFRSQCLPEGGDRATLQVIKITHRCGSPAEDSGGGSGSGAGAGSGIGLGTGSGSGSGAGNGSGSSSPLEQELADGGRAEVYSIYFEFNSDRIREQSEPTLEEIASILRRHPDWKLSIEGHTDSISSDDYNLELSERRAAAVKGALVERYDIEGSRLDTLGFGESSPKDTNDTIEGRARNRRVELVRQS